MFRFIISLALCLAFAPSSFARVHRAGRGLGAAVKEAARQGASAPVPGEVCFAPDEPCDVKLLRFIQGASVSLDVAIYDINLDQVIHALALSASHGVRVRVVVDQRQSKGPHSGVGLLVRAGVAVRYGHQRGIMHDKFTIVDGRQLETGSFNYTNHASEANQENQIYLDTPSVLARYRERFERIWDGGQAVN